jgi:hypothetical protein
MSISPSYSFIGGDRGSWEVTSMSRVIGEALEPAPFFEIRNEYLIKLPVDFRWVLRGVTSRQRHADDSEQTPLMAAQAQLGRPGATCAAFIPIKRKEVWWEMSQEDRREISGEKPHHIAEGLRNLPGVARKLHHCRDLGEPFDFLTWFEYDTRDSSAFEDFLAEMRVTEEWKYVEREVDVRLALRSA